jgi:hypothetical protein
MSVDKKISQLASGAPAQAGDEYVVARSGANYKLTLTNIAASMPPIGATTPNTGSFTSLTNSGNLTFSSTGQRITGDFSNATVANRLLFQNSVANAATSLGAIPNGTSTISGMNLLNNSDPTNAAFAGILIGSTEAQFRSAITGTGTYLPMTFYTGGSERMRLDTSGLLGLGLTPTASVGALQVSGGTFATSTMYVGAAGSTAFSGGIQNLSNTSRSISLEADPTNAGANTVMYFNLDGSTRMAIDSSGNVGIGTTSIAGKFNVGGGRSNFGANSEVFSIAVGYTQARCNSGQTYYIGATDSATPDLVFSNSAGTERMRISSSGNVAIGTTSTNPIGDNTVGTVIFGSGAIAITRDSNPPLLVNRKTNDGNLVEFYQDGVLEGSISVAGNTVSYNPFMGSHYTEIVGAMPTLKGTVLESLDELVDGKYSNQDRLPKAKVSDTVGSSAVYGVYFAPDSDPDTNDGILAAALGASWVRIAAGVTVQRGDLLESNGDGCAKVQSDDIIRSKTIGKVTSTTVADTYADGSYIVPCVLYCG